MDLRRRRVHSIPADDLSANGNTDDGGDGLLPRHVDLSGGLHVSERDMRGDSDLPVGNVYGRADMCGIRGNVLAESDLSALSIVCRDADLHYADMRWFRVMSRNDHVFRHFDLRTDSDLPGTLDMSGLSVHDGRKSQLHRPDIPWLGHMSGIVHMQRRQLCGVPDVRQSDLYLGTDMQRENFDVLVHADLPGLSVVRGYVHLRGFDVNLHWVFHVSWFDYMSGRTHL